MKDDNCIFCKLANGDIPTFRISFPYASDSA